MRTEAPSWAYNQVWVISWYYYDRFASTNIFYILYILYIFFIYFLAHGRSSNFYLLRFSFLFLSVSF